ncbi:PHYTOSULFOKINE 3 PRECURSOR [Prunus dulcis]|uniref:Phytosulfokine n=1 Tax=Prunus dulcis TaxID=3755 RepID=A0A4Y1RL51_PRUDU|nr:putative phytosulfokines 6 isoform X2 [Prunus dulcis]BBH05090.1 PHYTOSULFOKINE 3 PRECURSOR [Prunus dulcis]
MKQSFSSGAIVLCIFFIISSSTMISARLLGNQEGQEDQVELNAITDWGSLVESEGSELMNLIGVEDCTDGDEDCLNRRIMAEAHLDYIYTQHHKP